MKNLYSKKLKEVAKNDNRFILADINLKRNTFEYQSIWHGFKSKKEIRGPRFVEFPKTKVLKMWESLGFDIIVFDKRSLFQWLRKGSGKALFHINVIEDFFPAILEPLPSLESAEYGGFFGENTEIGRNLYRKKLSRTEKQKLRKEFGDRCFICKSTNNLTIHHIRERQFGGGTERLNSVLICQNCHAKINKKEIDNIFLHSLRYREGWLSKKVDSECSDKPATKEEVK